MTVFTYSQARQHFSEILDLANKEGMVLIKRKDGRIFKLEPDILSESPLDVKGIKTKVTTNEIISFVRESRER